MSDSKPGDCGLTQIIQEFEGYAGPWVFGVSLDLLLFGVLTVQTYVYYLAFPEDRRLLKLAVIWVYLVGLVQTILTIVDLSAFLVNLALLENGCPNSDNLINSLKNPVVHFWLTAIVFSEAALIAQWLYAYRIYVISGKVWIIILIVFLSLGQSGTSVVGSICLGIKPLSASGEVMFSNWDFRACALGFSWVWGPLNFLCDVTITVSMSILGTTSTNNSAESAQIIQLLKRRNGTLKKTTHARISRIVRIVVETGLATSIVVVVNTLTYNLPSISFVGFAFQVAWYLPGLIMGKVYSNSMLALLNSRLTIVGGRNTGDPFKTSEIRSEVLRTEVGGDQATSSVTRRRTTNRENPGYT